MKYQERLRLLNTGLFVIIILWGIAWLLVGAWYCFPNAEDFSLTAQPRDVGLISSTIDVMTHYDGRYFTNILHGFNPLAINWVRGYKLMPLVAITFLTASFWFFLNTIFISPKKRWLLSASFLFVVLHFANAPSLPHDLYWMVSSFVYLYPWAFTFLWLACYLRYIHLPKSANASGWFLATTVALFCCVGLNEMFLVTNFVLLSFLAFNSYRANKEVFIKTLPILIIGFGCILFFIASPGILERAANEREPGATLLNVKGMLQGISDYKTSFIRFFNNGGVICSALLLSLYTSNVTVRYPVINRLVNKKIWWWLLSFLIIAYVMTLAYYIPVQLEVCYPDRMLNSSVVLYQLVFFLLVPFMLAKSKLVQLVTQTAMRKNVTVFCLLSFILLSLLFSHNNFYRIQSEMRSGDYEKFNAVTKARCNGIALAKQQNSCWQVAELDSTLIPNSTIYYGPDISINRDPVFWRVAYEVYFQIDEIKLKGDTVSKL